MKIIVLDGYTENPGDLSWEQLEKLGDLTVYDRTPKDQILERIGDAGIIFTNKTPITAEIIAACPRLKYIGVLATGYNVVDVEAAGRAGITVTNIPAYGTDAVAQYTMALLLELCHHIGAHSDAVMAGEWSSQPDFCFWKYPMAELAGKTFGIIGFGKIGQKTAKLAQAFGMKVLAYSTHPKKELETEHCRYAALEQLLTESDVISLHCPLFPSTEGIINRDTIAAMKPGVLILNTARGPLIVEEDLRQALECGKVAGAAVDVVSAEPIREDNPHLDAPNMIITPHIAWASKEARMRLMDIAAENLRQYLAGTPQNVVSKP